MDDSKDLKPGLPVAGYRPQSDAAIAQPNREQRRRLAANGVAVHHIDGNPRNNTVSNLLVRYIREN